MKDQVQSFIDQKIPFVVDGLQHVSRTIAVPFKNDHLTILRDSARTKIFAHSLFRECFLINVDVLNQGWGTCSSPDLHVQVTKMAQALLVPPGLDTWRARWQQPLF